MQYNRLIGLDFETYSGVNLPKHGLHRYVNHPTFRPLLASVTWRHPTGLVRERLDFVREHDAVERLRALIEGKTIVAHNAGFEQAVLRAIGIDLPSERFIDSAVVARAVGAAGKLEAAAPQLLGVDKLEDGRRLIMLFAVPGKYQEAEDTPHFVPQIVDDNLEDWQTFGVYCDLDSELGLRIVEDYCDDVLLAEMANQTVTMDMNTTGWHVDLDTVEEMQRRYLENVEQAEAEFRATHDVEDPKFFNSLKQLKEWCAERGIKAQSFDEKNVAKMIERIKAKLAKFDAGLALSAGNQYENYCDVLSLLETKQMLGGSSLKKLQTILDTVGTDGRLHDQYLHIGAGQSWRTSGKGVQLQNLKRLDSDNIADMTELQDLEIEWDNDKLAENLRQVFTSEHPDGAIIVGDFSSVENRGLAWLAGQMDKLEAVRKGLDLYKVQATKMYSIAYDAVTKPQRQTGKVGELSCGYGAGGGAVQSFAEGMGVQLSEGEANKLVTDWRAANPNIVQLWWDLDEALHRAVELHSIETIRVGPSNDWKVRIYPTATPSTLTDQHPKAQSIGVEVLRPGGEVFLRRVIHGCYLRGRNICYYKPSELKSGDLWKNHFTDPKTKQVRFYTIYGGKLSGILTQSFCRELFFDSLRKVHSWVGGLENVKLIGQFHDEIVLDWQPAEMYGYGSGYIELVDAKVSLDLLMSNTNVADFPLAAEVKHDYRYTK